jgi:hypothetical protein
VTKRGGNITMGNWIPGDPTLVAQILKISSAYTPAPPQGFISPMLWGVESEVRVRFEAAGVPSGNISCVRDTYTFNFSGTPVELVNVFRQFYGPTMSAFDAAEKDGKADQLQRELESLFKSQNKSTKADRTQIAATFMRVTVVKM